MGRLPVSIKNALTTYIPQGLGAGASLAIMSPYVRAGYMLVTALRWPLYRAALRLMPGKAVTFLQQWFAEPRPAENTERAMVLSALLSSIDNGKVDFARMNPEQIEAFFQGLERLLAAPAIQE